MASTLILLIFTVFACIFAALSLKIAGESERFAIFLLGRFQAFKGPGLVLIAPFTHKAHRLRIGDVGRLKSPEFADFGGIDVPIADVGSLKPDQAVRIDGFDGVEPRIVASPVPPKSICPNCGHQF